METKDIKYIPMLKVINKEDGSIDFKVVVAIPIEYIEDWCNKEENYYDFKDFGKRLIDDWMKEK